MRDFLDGIETTLSFLAPYALMGAALFLLFGVPIIAVAAVLKAFGL